MRKRLEAGERCSQRLRRASARPQPENSRHKVPVYWPHDINGEKLAELDGVENITTQVLDVTDSTAIKQLITSHQAFDVLFNCAGFVHHGSVLDCTDEEWTWPLNLTSNPCSGWSKAVLPGMQALGRGSIVNISSIAAHKGAG